MALCKRCGNKIWSGEMGSDGLCDRCREKKKAQESAHLMEKLDEFRNHNGSPGNQRIFDAFIAKYPSALITGIKVTKPDEQLLVHLDGKPAYFVTFNPLTSEVDLVKYSDAMKLAEDEIKAKTQADAEAKAQAERDSNAGCSVWLAVFGILYGLFCMLDSYMGGIIGIVCSAIVLAGGASKSKGVVILGGALSFIAAVIGLPLSLGYFIFGIFYLCVGASM